ncbi:hypothetical protein DM813_04230 [Pseudomonas alkylphenolica]|uniref:Uncharacterized protein n=1 Tax=Pseudomonas alkylphenolica TaxID=237609 RepID=A0A443ZVJ6_9PSED|nr:hypothetical protein DM813_04230 [Pseudomonas alkylphenolica]
MQDGFTARANDRVVLMYDVNAEFNGVLISAKANHWNQFDLDNQWVGYWVHAKENTWLRYTLRNQWYGFTT